MPCKKLVRLSASSCNKGKVLSASASCWDQIRFPDSILLIAIDAHCQWEASFPFSYRKRRGICLLCGFSGSQLIKTLITKVVEKDQKRQAVLHHFFFFHGTIPYFNFRGALFCPYFHLYHSVSFVTGEVR